MAIRNLVVLGDGTGTIHTIRFSFGKHHFVEVADDGKTVTFAVGATHHGIKADASGLPSELEQFVEELRAAHPQNCVD